jgi:hypothetical protein
MHLLLLLAAACCCLLLLLLAAAATFKALKQQRDRPGSHQPVTL